MAKIGLLKVIILTDENYQNLTYVLFHYLTNL